MKIEIESKVVCRYCGTENQLFHCIEIKDESKYKDSTIVCMICIRKINNHPVEILVPMGTEFMDIK
jgi:hypothetical protein